jgi:hypothetical protein
LITGKFFGASTTFARSAGMIEKIFAAKRMAVIWGTSYNLPVKKKMIISK